MRVSRFLEFDGIEGIEFFPAADWGVIVPLLIQKRSRMRDEFATVINPLFTLFPQLNTVHDFDRISPSCNGFPCPESSGFSHLPGVDRPKGFKAVRTGSERSER